MSACIGLLHLADTHLPMTPKAGPMTDSAKVYRCTMPGCATLTTHWLCRAHSAPQPEMTPEHQPAGENEACAVLVARQGIDERSTNHGLE